VASIPDEARGLAHQERQFLGTRSGAAGPIDNGSEIWGGRIGDPGVHTGRRMESSSSIAGLERSTLRLALSKREAAAALGLSVDSFKRHVQPELRVVRRGRLRLFALIEIERWLHENGAKTIEPS
jgi:hypothetical protein